jgi:hypothetical protein
MPRLTLDPESLQVSTFATATAVAEGGEATLNTFGCTTTLKTQTTSDLV